MIKVLQVYRTYFPDTQGGVQETIRQICLSTQKHGIVSKVFTPSSNPDPKLIKSNEADIHRVKLNFEIASCGFCFSGISEFKRLVAWADIVHYHFPWPFADFLHLLSKVNKKTLVTYHSDIIRQAFLLKVYRPLMHRFLSSVSKIVCTSPNYFQTSNFLEQFSEKTEIIPIGLNDQSYPQSTSESIAAARRQFGEKFFLFVGVLRYYKGLHILLEAMQGTEFRVVIVGAGPIEKELKTQAKKLKLDKVIFAGHVSDEVKVALFKLCRGVVFPSYLRSEAFGVTLLEGAMFQKPLISTEVGSGTSHVNVHNETGLVVDPGDSAGLRKAMQLLHSDEQLASQLGHNARQRFEELFTGEIMGRQYAHLYKQLMSERELLSE